MMNLVRTLRPWLWMPVSMAHRVAPKFLRANTVFKSYQKLEWKPLVWRDLQFANPLGLAAGLDKDASQIKSWWRSGVGFVEVGTVVPKPQKPNPGKIMSRDFQTRTVWNKMGFPSQGMKQFKSNLVDLGMDHHTPIFINIGKNRETPNDKAHLDYISLIQDLSLFADAFVINISSPNTKGLRSLAEKSQLEEFLGPVLEHRNKMGNTPLLLKLSPDHLAEELDSAISVSNKMGIDGWVLTNTTLHRENQNWPNEGGLSGRPLAEKSKQALKTAKEVLGSSKGDKLLVSVGGVITPDDVFERLELGADLIEVYSTLIFEGPWFFSDVFKEYQQKLNKTKN